MTLAAERRSRTPVLALAVLVAVGCGTPAPTASSPPSAPTATGTREVDPITAEEILTHVKFLADDACEGRMTGEPGCEKAAAYLAVQFQQIGLEPAGDFGTWYQHFDAISGRKVLPTSTVRFGDRELALDKDYAVATGVGTAHGEGELLFVGFGIRSQTPPRDDYAGLDASGKVVIALLGAPGRADGSGDFLDTSEAGRLARARAKIDVAFAQKAAALILIQNPLEQKEAADRLPDWNSDDRGGGLTFPAVQVTAATGRGLLAQAGLDLDAVLARLEAGEIVAEAVTGFTAAVRNDTAPLRRHTWNVVGRLTGARKEECLVVGAHYDHLGFGGSSSLSGEKAIHNGADDNASGSAALVEIARSCALDRKLGRLNHSVVFIAFSGEELGLLGSAWYCEHPVVPLDQTIAMLNLDMVGRSKEGYCAVGAISSAAPFRDIVTRAEGLDPPLGLQLALSDGGMAQGSSDHQSFLNAKVPSLFFFSGLHEDYHKPSDDTDKINADGAARIAELCHRTLVGIDALADPPVFVPPPAPPTPTSPANPHAGITSAPASGGRPWFGSIPSFGDTGEGVLFDGVTAGSPAEKAGIKKGDRLVEWNGRPVKTLEDFTAVLSGCKVGDVIKAGIQRDGARIDVELTLALRPQQ